ncbi:signal recognition particle-docking protein FtsY [Lactobacillus alvi]|uniref:Signal recognition particle receptor FtsY n=1 Tax=Limosilactobacillus alvi TaxID=990412 RepID=A0ABS2ELI4_9LACO|nr:signal recognition particle-docking protein FtsY [Limosilactobacillus alvi]MBM6753332.1 signal recognition particle-docking protein FtsY [Limosilactobacillus alvi]
MGLFDIFRRKKKTENEEVTPKKENEQVKSTTASEHENSEGTTVKQGNEPQTAPAIESEAQSATDEEPQKEGEEEKNASANGEDQLVDQPAETKSVSDEVDEHFETNSAISEPNQVEPKANEIEKQTAATLTAEKVSGEINRETPADIAPVVENEQVSGESKTETEAEEEPSTSTSDTDETETPTEESRVDEKYDRGLEKSRSGFGARLNKFLANFRHVDEDFFEDLEDLLIESDVGYEMAMQLSDSLREEVKLQNAKSKQDVSNVIIEKMVELYEAAGENEKVGINFASAGPTVIMFVGVNGAGKTTTIGKMAAAFKREGKKVLLAAADTFRAGATEQLAVWAKRDGVDIVTGPEKGDPAAVVFDGVKKAKEEDYDVLFVDTAGRLQNKVNLMNELAKMKKILTREIPDAPHEVLLVLDATTGQNALNQAKIFKENTDVTGIVLTKLDGTARGGIVLAIRNELHLPVKYVGLGEKVDDLQTFDPAEFVYGLFKGLVVTK